MMNKFCNLLVAFLLLFIASCNDAQETKTIYLAYCSDYKIDYFFCPKEKISVSKKEYKIFLDKQLVIAKSENFVYQLEGCSIFDKNNWQCIGDWNERVSIKDGAHFNSRYEDYHQIFIIEYYLRYIFSFLK